MKIYYNSSLWSNDKGFPGLPQRVNWQFEYAGTKRYIPVIYRFPEGIVFDIITVLDEAKLREFFEKYENTEEKLTPLQKRCARQEHPFQAMSIKEIWINGKRVESGYSSSNAVSIPWAQKNNKLMSVQKTYSAILKNTDCFACERFCVPYPETDSKIQRLLCSLRLKRIDSLKLSTHSVQKFYPLNIQFDMLGKEDQKVASFRHPMTGIAHTLYFQKAELVEMPLGANINRSFYAAQSLYEIEPALPKGDGLQFDSSIHFTESREDRLGLAAASSVGIIGGASGPTSVFVSKVGGEKEIPRGMHGLPLNICFSVPSFKKDSISHFLLEGINIKKIESKEYNFKKHF